ncbi:MAG: tetratricopeptide repeat protein [Crocinitomicaceae bacterium]|nr:tetratricopeptide repeat protein [Crocinitomicaceae bacterium]
MHTFSKGKGNTDSLKIDLQQAETSEDKISVLLELGQAYTSENKDSAALYLDMAYQLAGSVNNISAQSKAAAMLGLVYQYENDVKSTDYIFISLDLAEQSGDNLQKAYVYNIVGSHYRGAGELEKSIEYYNKSLSIREFLVDSTGMAVCFNNLGISYMMSGKYDTGLDYWKRSLDMKLAYGDSLSAAYTMANIAIYYKDIDRILEAVQYAERALEIELANKDFMGASHCTSLLGEIYNKTENYPKAISWFNQSLAYSDSAATGYDKLEPMMGLAIAYEGLGDYKNAYFTLQEYQKLYKYFNGETTAQISLEMQTKYETEKREKENLELKNKTETQDLKLKEETARNELQEANNRYLMMGLGAAVLLIGIIFFALRRVRQSKILVEEQKHIVEEKNKEITDSINYAKRIQAAILPPDRLVKNFLPDSFVLYKPKDIVAGDFYWLHQADDEILFAAADCTGHGVPGAMVSVVCNNALNRSVREYGLKDPGKILDKTREIVIAEFEKSDEEVKDGMDISLVAIQSEFENGKRKLNWAGANNPLWILRKGSIEIEEIKPDKQPIGKYADAKPFKTNGINLQKGDALYIFTDGYQDQFGGEKGKKFKASNLKNLIIENKEKSMTEQKEIINSAFEGWKGNLEQVDDVCVIGLRI